MKLSLKMWKKPVFMLEYRRDYEILRKDLDDLRKDVEAFRKDFEDFRKYLEKFKKSCITLFREEFS